ncbi:MAG: hypothetical protein ACYTGS_04060 [Planctomycetota bacterium]|jgi:hypothetical protein
MFIQNLKYITVVCLKFCAILAVCGLACAIIMYPAFTLGMSIHWSLGAAWGIVSFVLLTALLMTLMQRAESERPIMDWLDKTAGPLED